METDDILPHHVTDRRPVLLPKPAFFRISGGCQIVNQSIKPDIDHMALIPGDGNPPFQRRPGNGQILQAAFNKAGDFVIA